MNAFMIVQKSLDYSTYLDLLEVVFNSDLNKDISSQHGIKLCLMVVYFVYKF